MSTRRSRRWRAVVAGLVVAGALLAGVFAYLKTNRFEVVLTADQIQAVLAEHFPVSKSYLLVVEATYSEPVVTLVPGSDRIGVRLSADVGLKLPASAKRFHASCDLISGIEYKPDTHQFFLSEPEVQMLAIEGVPREVLETVRRATLKLASEHLQSFPIYTVEPRGLRMNAARLLLQEVSVKDGALHLSLGL